MHSNDESSGSGAGAFSISRRSRASILQIQRRSGLANTGPEAPPKPQLSRNLPQQPAAPIREDPCLTSKAQGRWWCLKRARDLCQTHKRLVIAAAISLIVVVVLGGIFSRVIGPFPPESPSCPNKWMRSDGKCYFISGETNDWNSSLEFCRSEGGTLLTTDDETQEDIKTLSNLTGEYWVGLKKEGGEWKQMDGSVWTGPIEYDGPQLSCCVLDSGRYLAFACSTHRPWICVKSAVGGISNAGSTDRDQA